MPLPRNPAPAHGPSWHTDDGIDTGYRTAIRISSDPNDSSTTPPAVGNVDSDARKDVVIDCGPLYGIWKSSNNSSCSQEHGTNAQALAVAGTDKSAIDDLAVSFGDPYRLWVLKDGSNWQSLHFASPPR